MLTQQELLIGLVEECGEAIQAATKCLRFGPKGNHPTYGNNTTRLADEVGDLLGIIDALNLPSDQIQIKREAKLSRMEKKKEQYGYE